MQSVIKAEREQDINIVHLNTLSSLALALLQAMQAVPRSP